MDESTMASSLCLFLSLFCCLCIFSLCGLPTILGPYVLSILMLLCLCAWVCIVCVCVSEYQKKDNHAVRFLDLLAFREHIFSKSDQALCCLPMMKKFQFVECTASIY